MHDAAKHDFLRKGFGSAGLYESIAGNKSQMVNEPDTALIAFLNSVTTAESESSARRIIGGTNRTRDNQNFCAVNFTLR